MEKGSDAEKKASSSTGDKRATKRSWFSKVWIWIVIVVVIWGLVPFIIVAFHKSIGEAGQFGDVYGSVNALFSALAFALLIYTSWMQKNELELQRNEIELNREQLEKSASAQDEIRRLTQEGLDFQKHIRRGEIKPELALDTTRWIPKTDGTHMLEVGLKTLRQMIRNAHWL